MGRNLFSENRRPCKARSGRRRRGGRTGDGASGPALLALDLDGFDHRVKTFAGRCDGFLGSDHPEKIAVAGGDHNRAEEAAVGRGATLLRLRPGNAIGVYRPAISTRWTSAFCPFTTLRSTLGGLFSASRNIFCQRAGRWRRRATAVAAGEGEGISSVSWSCSLEPGRCSTSERRPHGRRLRLFFLPGGRGLERHALAIEGLHLLVGRGRGGGHEEEAGEQRGRRGAGWSVGERHST